MRIKIHTPVEFEKIIPNDWSESITITRKRLSLQQMLESGEQPEHLVQRVADYCKSAHLALLHVGSNAQEPLLQQPLFQWEIDQNVIVSPCWRFEALMPNALLANLRLEEANAHMKNGNYKDAHACYTKSKELHEKCVHHIKLWTWKLPEMNHTVLQPSWHKSRSYICQGSIHLATLAVGLERGSSSSVLYTVAQRAVRSYARAAVEWMQIDVPMKLAEIMRYYFSSDILWNAEQFGASIHRLKTWVHGQQQVDASLVPIFLCELEKVPDLLNERRQTNDAAYFDVVKAGPPLPSPETLIRIESIDMPHPSTSGDVFVEDGVHTETGES